MTPEGEETPTHSPLDVTPMQPVEQFNLLDELQAGLLRTYLKRLKDGTITDTGMATLQRLLAASGLVLDKRNLPKELQDQITEKLPVFDPDDVDDPDVVGRIAS